MKFDLKAPRGKGLRDGVLAKVVIVAETERDQKILADAVLWIHAKRREIVLPIDAEAKQ